MKFRNNRRSNNLFKNNETSANKCASNHIREILQCCILESDITFGNVDFVLFSLARSWKIVSPAISSELLLRKFSGRIDCSFPRPDYFYNFSWRSPFCPFGGKQPLERSPKLEDPLAESDLCTCLPLIFIRRANDVEAAPLPRLTKLPIKTFSSV